MIHEDNPAAETMTEAHVLQDKEPVRVDPDKVYDESKQAYYKPTWNRAKFQHKADVEAYEEFMREEMREREIMQVKGEW